MSDVRRCSKCGDDKPLELFRPVKPGKGRKDNLHSWCNPCLAADSNQRWHRNREASLARSREQYRKHHAKRLAEMREYHAQHRDARLAQMEAWRTENPEAMAEAKRRWNQNNPDKVNEHRARRHARLKGAPEIETIDRAYIYARDNGVCHICKKHVPRKGFTLDHLIPLAHNGPHTHANLAVAHRSCNARMHAARLPAQLLLVG